MRQQAHNTVSFDFSRLTFTTTIKGPLQYMKLLRNTIYTHQLILNNIIAHPMDCVSILCFFFWSPFNKKWSIESNKFGNIRVVNLHRPDYCQQQNFVNSNFQESDENVEPPHKGIWLWWIALHGAPGINHSHQSNLNCGNFYSV